MTYVLVHGGGSTGRYWDRLLPFLDRPALAVDLPGRNAKPADLATITVAAEVASVVADIEAATVPIGVGPLVLVAHSSGGLVVPGVVAALTGRVDHVVLSAALVPPEGGYGVDCMQARHRDGLIQSVGPAPRDRTDVVLPGPPADSEAMRNAYGGPPLDDATLAYVVDPARNVPDTINHYFQPVYWSVAASVPVTYVVNEQDRPIPASLQDEMISRLPHSPHVVRLPTGHLAAVTAPEAFAAILVAIEPVDAGSARMTALEVHPIGVVESPLTERSSAPKQGHEGAPDAWLVVDPDVGAGLEGLHVGDRVIVLTWLDRAQRDVLRVRPRDDPDQPERGVFGTRSPDRPNPIGLHPVEILAIEGNRVHVRDLEALDGTPIVDIKPVLGREFERGE